MPLPWSMEMTRPPPLLRQPAEVTTPASAATTELPYEAAMSTARCPAWMYWVIEPAGTGQASGPPTGATTVTAGADGRSVVPTEMRFGPGSGGAAGSTGTGVGLGLSVGRMAGALRAKRAGSSGGRGSEGEGGVRQS